MGREFKLLVSADRIQTAVIELARQIDHHYSSQGVHEITMVCVMNASFIFCADLMRSLQTPSRIIFTRARSYQGTAKGQTAVLPIENDLSGRRVLVVDTIYDTGETIQKVVAEVRRQTPHVAVAVLLVKEGKLRGPLPDHIPFAGIRLPGDPFAIGYGLDVNGDFRNLKDIREYRAADEAREGAVSAASVNPH